MTQGVPRCLHLYTSNTFRTLVDGLLLHDLHRGHVPRDSLLRRRSNPESAGNFFIQQAAFGSADEQKYRAVVVARCTWKSWSWCVEEKEDQVSISSPFYTQLFCWYFCAKNFQSRNITREKLCKALFYVKCVSKILMKLTTGVNFINILT